MSLSEVIIQFRNFLRKDTWSSFSVSLILIIIFIKFLFFPVLATITSTPLPLVVVESCSMYHPVAFDGWWGRNQGWYEARNITKENFKDFSLKNGLNKGDIVFVWGRGEYKQGDIIIFNAETRYPIIHRIITEKQRSTKGDNNPDQLSFERTIADEQVIGKAVGRIPLLGWIKLIFFEFLKNPEARGFCK